MAKKRRNTDVMPVAFNGINELVGSFKEVSKEGITIPVIVCYDKSNKEFPGKYFGRLYDMNCPRNAVVTAEKYKDLVKKITESWIGIGEPFFAKRRPKDDPAVIGRWL